MAIEILLQILLMLGIITFLLVCLSLSMFAFAIIRNFIVAIIERRRYGDKDFQKFILKELPRLRKKYEKLTKPRKP